MWWCTQIATTEAWGSSKHIFGNSRPTCTTQKVSSQTGLYSETISQNKKFQRKPNKNINWIFVFAYHFDTYLESIRISCCKYYIDTDFQKVINYYSHYGRQEKSREVSKEMKYETRTKAQQAFCLHKAKSETREEHSPPTVIVVWFSKAKIDKPWEHLPVG